jgi:hypothetical protein
MSVLVRHVKGCMASEEQMLAEVRRHAAEMAAERVLTVCTDPIYIETARVPHPSGQMMTVDIYEIVAQCPGSV